MKLSLHALRRAALAVGIALPLLAQAAPAIWRDVKPADIPAVGLRQIQPLRTRTFQMEPASLQALLRRAPAPGVTGTTLPTLLLPMPDGRDLSFRIAQSRVMQPGLAAKFPMIKTYVGTATADASITARFQWDPRGFRAMIFSPKGTVFIDPYSRGDSRNYQVYFAHDMPAKRRPVDTLYTPKKSLASKSASSGASAGLLGAANRGASISGDLRTYRVAIGTTYEYASYHDPIDPPTRTEPRKSVVMAELVNVVNRVSGVYERELGIRMELIDGNENAIYTTPAQPYTDQAGPGMVEINTAVLDLNVGNENYDIGHVASTGGGGIAGLGVVCNTESKGAGVTGLGDPVGDGYYIDFVAHEMGHQFGANHTYNGDEATNCDPNRNASTAYEPGSGVTIMGYAGVCSEQNIADHSIDTFNAASFDEIYDYSRNGEGNTCPIKTNVSNNTPMADAGLGGFSIPKQTPFLLTGASCDADNDALTYQWEEYDLGPAGTPNGAATTTAPLFRSFLPTASPTRVFPQPSDLINNTQTLGEILPNTNRPLKFRLTVRDNQVFPQSGGVASADLAFSVTASAGPFLVTSPNTAQDYAGGQAITVTWNVANTTAAPVSCPNVDIALSSDGGLSFPISLASGVANDGSQAVNLPLVSTSEARIRVKCSNNVFFDISNVDFNINKQAPVLAIASGYENPDTNGAYNLSWVRPNGASGPDTLMESSSCGPSFADDASEALAQGANSKWTGSVQWTSMTNSADSSAAYFIPDLVMQNESLSLINPIAIPAGATASLRFTTRQGLEDGYDFGHVEVQIGSGAWQTLASYTGPSEAITPDGVFDGIRSLDLSAFAGKSIRLRFRLESDEYTVGAPAGWYLDNIEVVIGNFSDLVTVAGTSHAIAGHAIGSYCYRVRSAYTVDSGLAPSLDSNLVTVNITATNLLPVARLVASETRGKVPLAVSFNAGSSSDPDSDNLINYTFNFGDGSAIVRQASPLASHSYTSAGSYTASVSVTDARGGVSASPASLVIDALEGATDPTPFSFAERSNVRINTFISSEAVMMSGYSGSLGISVSGGLQYSLDGGAFTAENGSIANGSRLVVRHVSASTENTPKQSSVTVGGYSTVFRTITTTLDRTPDNFSFGSLSNQEPGALVMSASPGIRLSGFNTAIPIIAGPDVEYSLDDGASWTRANGSLVPDTSGNPPQARQTLRVRHTNNTASLGYSKTYLKVGGVTGYFTTRTRKTN